ncbi:hypothetical protein Bbelb_130610 [Branchiostoma belcheri]|nr:hypothetical protein Bbelb_130610 [Branchiostoma belcheri]
MQRGNQPRFRHSLINGWLYGDGLRHGFIGGGAGDPRSSSDGFYRWWRGWPQVKFRPGVVGWLSGMLHSYAGDLRVGLSNNLLMDRPKPVSHKIHKQKGSLCGAAT